MKKKNRYTLKELAEQSDIDIEEALIMLWDAGLEEIHELNDVLIGARLQKARKVLNLPDGKQIKSKEYWKNKLNLTDDDFDLLSLQLGIEVNRNAKILPKGSIQKLKRELEKQPIFIPIQQAIEVDVAEPIKIKASQYELVEIGHTKIIRYLNSEEIEKIHFALVEDFNKQEDPINPAGVRSDDLLKSAAFRPHTSNGEKLKYPTVEMSAAALVHSLIHNHPFHNGNKRTALVSLLVFLDENSRMITCDEAELFKFVLQVAQHRIGNSQLGDAADKEVFEISKWILNNSRWIEKGERTIPFRRLRQILNDYDCIFGQVGAGCNMQITREIEEKKFLKKKKKILKTHIYYGGDGRDVNKSDLGKIRNDLRLNEENGVDSYVFYNRARTSIDEFIVNYRKTLKRLAGM